jgi:hypothetical protein
MSQYETYRASGCLWMIGLIIILGLGTGATIAVVRLLPDDVHGGLATGIMVGIVLFSTAIALLYGVSTARRSKRSAEAMLSESGFTFISELTDTQRAQLLKGVGRWARVRETPSDLTWGAIKEMPAGQAVVFHHQYTTGSGKTTQVHTRIVVALPVQRQIQIVSAFRRNFFERWIDRKQGAQDIEIGEPKFDKRFCVQCVDPSLATRVLSERVRELMMTGPKQESWVFAPSHVLCVFAEEASAHSVGVMIRRTQIMIDLLARSGV